MADDSSDGKWAAVISACAAAISAIAAVVALVATNSFNSKNDERADRQDARSAQQEERLARQEERQDRQERQEVASKVYLGEAPQYYRQDISEDDRCPPPDGCRNRVVINASGTQVNNVWIEYENGNHIKIQGIQRCTLYDLPIYPKDGDRTAQNEPLRQFEPEALYFTDANGSWVRSKDGSMDQIEEETVIEGLALARFGESNAIDIKDCGG